MGEPVHQQRLGVRASGVAINQPTGRGLQAGAAQGTVLAEEADAPDQQSLICCQNELVGINNPVPLSRGIAVRVPISRGFVVGIHSSALRRSRWVAGVQRRWVRGLDDSVGLASHHLGPQFLRKAITKAQACDVIN
ncbi:hypothetical protein KBY70_00975 [Cyanobium sp. ATX 6E8]|uniref:hypothetical protein n=1 Tax=Cyanobium sp. ATX 6E8 TaxID=2823701 RepID=UPI0020CE64B6|nr:hypothetical protein [Cyanobium sp. ATX 6E8]MCP9940976.1 hypothetical protein [Cyanobium sp. ATX 6E8]